MPSECRHCWHRSEETHGVICCWCGIGGEVLSSEIRVQHGPHHPVLVPAGVKQ